MKVPIFVRRRRKEGEEKTVTFFFFFCKKALNYHFHESWRQRGRKKEKQRRHAFTCMKGAKMCWKNLISEKFPVHSTVEHCFLNCPLSSFCSYFKSESFFLLKLSLYSASIWGSALHSAPLWEEIKSLRKNEKTWRKCTDWLSTVAADKRKKERKGRKEGCKRE